MPNETPAAPAPAPAAPAAPAKSSIRETLSRAIDAQASPRPAAPTPTPAAKAAEPKPGPVVEKKPALKPTAPARGPNGQFLPQDAQPDAAPEEKPDDGAGVQAPALAEAGAGEAEAGKPDDVPPADAAPEEKPAPKTKPPRSWKATAKEVWDKVPPEAQAEVLRLESASLSALQKAHDLEKEAGSLRTAMGKLEEVAKPYQEILRAEGTDLAKSFGGYLQTVHGLTHGTPATRAAVVADVIKRFSVSVDLLADALDGKAAAPAGAAPQPAGGQPAPVAPPVPAAPPEYRDPRVDQILAAIQQGRQGRIQQAATQQQRAWAQFEADSANEFLESLQPGQEAEPGSVRDLMAQVWEIHERQNLARAKTGQPPLALTLQEAYSRACQLHPEVSKVLRQREEAQRAETANAATRRAQAASTSVKTEPTGAPQPKPKGLRQQIEAAYNASVGG